MLAETAYQVIEALNEKENLCFYLLCLVKATELVNTSKHQLKKKNAVRMLKLSSIY
jgi:hypothetical protein